MTSEPFYYEIGVKMNLRLIETALFVSSKDLFIKNFIIVEYNKSNNKGFIK